jgi:hypothetical protein
VSIAAGDVASQTISTSQSEASRWQLEATVVGAVPTSDVFREGWGAGYGLGGALRRRLGSRVQLGIEADFAQFSFTGLQGFGTLGGARREFGVAVPMHILLWERLSPGREHLALVGSAGWGWQQVEGTFEGSSETEFSRPTNGDGFRAAAELRFSRILYRTTRWNIGARWTTVDLTDETPQYVSLILGAQMPLSGSRPQ